MLFGVAACSPSGVPGTNSNLTPPDLAERPAPPAQAENQPGTPVPLTPPPGSGPSAELSIPGPPAPPPAAPPPPEATVAAAPPAPPPASGFGFALPPWPFFASNLPVPGQLPGPRLTLSNFSYDRAHVEAAITSNPDCDTDTVSRVEFDLAYNGTRVIEPPAGDDVCWRRDTSTNGAGGPQWSRWNRAYLSAGQSVDSRL